MVRIAAVLALAFAAVAGVELSYRLAFRRALIRLTERERGLRPTGELEVFFSRFGTEHPEPRIGGLEDAFEAARFRLTADSRLRDAGNPEFTHAYFLATFTTRESDFDRACAWRGYLWSPRTWSFHPWPG